MKFVRILYEFHENFVQFGNKGSKHTSKHTLFEEWKELGSRVEGGLSHPDARELFLDGATQVNQLQTEADLPLPESPQPTSLSLMMEDAFEAQFWDQEAEEVLGVVQVSFLQGGKPGKPTPCTLQECKSQFHKADT